MASQDDINGLIRRFRDVDGILATLGDRTVTYTIQGRTGQRTEPANEIRIRVERAISWLSGIDPSTVRPEHVVELHVWIDRLESEAQQPGPPAYLQTAIIVTGVVALAVAALLS